MTESRLFALPVVGRSGLGNMLFPWARAELFARASGARILAPVWTSARIGPYLRREPVKRLYYGFFRAPNHERGVSRMMIAALGRRIAETQIAAQMPGLASAGRPNIVVFSGLGNLFTPLFGAQHFIRDRLWTMSKPKMRSSGAVYGDRFIGMHVRRGDITRQGFTPERLKTVGQYTPISWFVSMAQAVRSNPELRPLPIVVFSDGSEAEIAPLRTVENVVIHQRRSALEDLWTLSHANLLFASGFSTFSMWASYLGGGPTIYAPGKIQQRVQTGLEAPFEIELSEGGDLPPEAAARALRP